MTALICGSMAYDNIMVFEGRFEEHILPDQIRILNVAFLVPELRREFGGCAGNIAYNMHLLGESPVIMATVGNDFDAYRARLNHFGISDSHIREVDETLTAQAYITTDLDDNQITAFHPGAMDHSHVNAIAAAGDIRLGAISPDGRQGMIAHAAQFADAGIPFLFDPGQGLPMFDGPELTRFIDKATWLAVNDYECKLLCDRTGLAVEAIADKVDALIITRGGQGSIIYANGETIEIPAVKPKAVLDPTGCGDAYRAGLLFGLLRGWSWADTGRLASLLGSKKVEHRGTQNHLFSRDGLAKDFERAFGYTIEL